MKNKIEPGHRLVEILHIDTILSRKFFRDVGASAKCDCERLLELQFVACCDGALHVHWEGDGGAAYFEVDPKNSGTSIRAAKKFLNELPQLHQQTVDVLKGRKTARRFRIKAHFASIYFDGLGGFAGDPEALDEFLKYERDLAPEPDRLFITGALYESLDWRAKREFKLQKENSSYGDLHTALYKLPANQSARLEIIGRNPEDLTRKEWKYLKRSLEIQTLLTVARNSITVDLTGSLSRKKNGLLLLMASELRFLTLRAIYNFLRAAFPREDFNVVMWRPDKIGKATHLAKLEG